jgi:phosphatidylinositol glycan class B
MSADPRPPSGDEAADGPKDEPPFDFAAHHDSDLHAVVKEQTATDVFWVLLTFRFFNSLCVRTFFQPDEYFQALEPAWQMAFGPESGAWITWVRTTSPLSALVF